MNVIGLAVPTSTDRPNKTARSSVASALFVYVLALVLALGTSGEDAHALWVQPVADQPGAVGVAYGRPDIAQVGSTVYHVAVEISGTDRNVVVRRLAQGDTQWRLVGAPLNYGSNTGATGAQIADVAGVPYVTWQQQDQITGVVQVYVKRLTAVPLPDTWEPVGPALNLDVSRTALDPAITAIGGVAHVALVQATSSNRTLRVVREAAGTWTPVGPALNINPTGDAERPRLFDRSGVLTVVWSESIAGVPDANVARLDAGGASYTVIGSAVTRPEGAGKACRIAEWNANLVVGCLADVAGVDRFIVKRFDEAGPSWEALGSALNVTTGSAAEPSLVTIGDRLYAAHGEQLGGSRRSFLSRYDEAATAWLVLPEPIGAEDTAFARMANVGSVPWVARTASDGTASVLQLAPSVTDFDVSATIGDAVASVHVDEYGLPYAIRVEAVGAEGVHAGVLGGGPPSLSAVFSGLVENGGYEARVIATDPFAREFTVGQSGFFTERSERSYDHDQPEVSLRFNKRTRRPPLIRGRAADVGVGVARVEVAIMVRRSARCRWLVGVSFVSGACDTPRWATAEGVESFRYRLARRSSRRLRRSAYEVYARAVDGENNVSETVAYRCTKYIRSRRGARRDRRPVSRCAEWQ